MFRASLKTPRKESFHLQSENTQPLHHKNIKNYLTYSVDYKLPQMTSSRHFLRIAELKAPFEIESDISD